MQFDAHVVDGIVSDASPGILALELRNATQTTQHVSAGTVPPFGLVRADAVEGSDGFLLWREYESEGCVTFADDGILQCDIGTVTKLNPCESITRRYEILPSETTVHPEYTAPPGQGTYRITDSISYSAEQGGPGSQLTATVTFTLESA